MNSTIKSVCIWYPPKDKPTLIDGQIPESARPNTPGDPHRDLIGEIEANMDGYDYPAGMPNESENDFKSIAHKLLIAMRDLNRSIADNDSAKYSLAREKYLRQLKKVTTQGKYHYFNAIIIEPNGAKPKEEGSNTLGFPSLRIEGPKAHSGSTAQYAYFSSRDTRCPGWGGNKAKLINDVARRLTLLDDKSLEEIAESLPNFPDDDSD